MLRRFTSAALAFGFVVATAVSGCLAPTLPLPPPESPDLVAEAAQGQGYWDVGGFCVPGATVTIVNDRTGRGAVVEDRAGSGRYRATIEADECDLALVQQEVDGELSGETSFTVTETENGSPTGDACR